MNFAADLDDFALSLESVEQDGSDDISLFDRMFEASTLPEPAAEIPHHQHDIVRHEETFCYRDLLASSSSGLPGERVLA